jgi:hypothetical protein
LTAALLIACNLTAMGESLAPLATPAFTPGAMLTVTSPQAGLQLGSSVIATLSRGQRVVVAQVHDQWIGTLVSVDGQQKAGWIESSHFLPADPPTMACAARLPADVQVYTANRLPVTDSDDPFLIGRFQRYETDPNMHVWEPWRR